MTASAARVLVVDDNETLVENLKEILEDAGRPEHRIEAARGIQGGARETPRRRRPGIERRLAGGDRAGERRQQVGTGWLAGPGRPADVGSALDCEPAARRGRG